MLEQMLSRLENELSISPEHVLTIASRFQEHMEEGLLGNVSSLRMFPSYLQAPSRKEAGIFLALDFGGTNVRSAVIELKGHGKFVVLKKQVRPLSHSYCDSKNCRDLRGIDVNAEVLFDFLADMINEVVDGTSVPLPLGFTFSFPYRQRTLTEGFLLNWDKEIKTTGVVGKDVGQLLSAALTCRGLGNVIQLVAILNDTVATFLTAAYEDPDVDIASIIGTGHNTCYLEQKATGFDTPIIINTESGNFSAVPSTNYDLRLDQQSDNPGDQLFEKKLSGKYLGELCRQIILEFSQCGLLDSSIQARWNNPYSITGKVLALILSKENAQSKAFLNADYLTLKRIADLITRRSARLMAASLIGVLRHLDPQLNKRHTIAVDGSLYEGIPGYAHAFESALHEALKNKASMVTLKLSTGGSLIGAAIAAARQYDNI